MMKYRKKPVEIEAMQMPLDTGHRSQQQALVREIAVWMADSGYEASEYFDDVDEEFQYDGAVLADYGANYLEIETLEGTMTARPGDYIIKGVQGEFYPCKPDIFEQTYEAVDA